MAGANIIYGMGMLELGITFDFAQLVMDNEMARMIKKAVGGITVDDETLAVDVIKSVGAGGEFISQDHTFRHFREQSSSSLIDRHMRDGWLAEGGKDFTERCYEKARYILENHKPDPLPAGAADTMRNIVAEAEAELACDKEKEITNNMNQGWRYRHFDAGPIKYLPVQPADSKKLENNIRNIE